jgi:AbrB family looped-hinge helix DNA binding protein
MTSAKLTSKSGVTIPAKIRRLLNVQPCDSVEFVQIASRRIELVAAVRTVRELKGMFGKADRAVSVDEMNRTVAECWADSCPCHGSIR